MATSADTLRLVRKTHLYFGLFISPALLFFAFTGALQTFSLHETTQGSSYKPPRWAVVLGQIHKKETYIVPVRKGRPGDRPAEGKAPEARQGDAPPPTAATPHPDASAGSPESQAATRPGAAIASAATPAPGRPGDPGAARPRSHLPLKIFFLIVSIGLFTSTLTGIYMSYKYDRNKVLVSALLVVGTILPLLLLPF